MINWVGIGRLSGWRTVRYLGVALDGAGAHPAAWRAPGAGRRPVHRRAAGRAWPGPPRAPGSTSSPSTTGSTRRHPGSATLPGRFDALLALARVAPATTSIGLVPTVTTTHTEPFHVSKNVATLDLVSGGRAGWQVAVSTTDEAAAGLRPHRSPRPAAELWAEAEDAIEVVSRLWDSWEDDAVIRDRATGRYIDRDKLHYIDFEGRVLQRPRPVDHAPLAAGPAARGGHGGATTTPPPSPPGGPTSCSSTPPTPTRPAGAGDDIRGRVAAAGRDPDDVAVLAVARVGEPALRAELDRLAARAAPAPALDVVGDAAEVAATLDGVVAASGAVDGFLVRPDVLPTTLDWFVDEVVPRLGRAPPSDRATLRDRFGLARPANRYATAEAAP